MLLVFPLVYMLLCIIKIAYWNYNKYSNLRKRFKGYRNVILEPFEMKKHNLFIYGSSNSCETTFTKDFCSLYDSVNVFCIDAIEWKE